jgi:hypothetical protein
VSVDPSTISPSDAAVAIRSYPRRWRGAFAVVEDEEQGQDLLRRGDPSALDLLGRAVACLRGTDGWLRTTLVSDRPELTPWPAAPDGSLDELDAAADALAGSVEAVDADAWQRTARLSGRELTALDLVRQAVVSVSDDLREAERTLREQVGRPG